MRKIIEEKKQGWVSKMFFKNRDVNLKSLILFYIGNVVFHTSVSYLSEN